MVTLTVHTGIRNAEDAETDTLHLPSAFLVWVFGKFWNPESGTTKKGAVSVMLGGHVPRNAGGAPFLTF